MNILDAQAVVDEIVQHINSQGGSLTDWYAGITSDIDRRVFGDHAVPRENYWRIHRKAESISAARDAEKALLEWGCDGGGGGGDTTSVFVYAYLKSSVTRP